MCNHPDLFEPRPIVSPFVCGTLVMSMPTAAVVHDCVRSCIPGIEPVHPALAFVMGGAGASLVDLEWRWTVPDIHGLQRARVTFEVR